MLTYDLALRGYGAAGTADMVRDYLSSYVLQAGQSDLAGH